MKRFLAAASLAVLATSAVAAEIGKPFEQVELDRALPNIETRTSNQTGYPSTAFGERTQFAAAAGETRSDAVNGAEEKPAVSPFAHQHDFIAPAQ